MIGTWPYCDFPSGGGVLFLLLACSACGEAPPPQLRGELAVIAQHNFRGRPPDNCGGGAILGGVVVPLGCWKVFGDTTMIYYVDTTGLVHASVKHWNVSAAQLDSTVKYLGDSIEKMNGRAERCAESNEYTESYFWIVKSPMVALIVRRSGDKKGTIELGYVIRVACDMMPNVPGIM